MSKEIEIANDDTVITEKVGGRDLTQVLHEKGVMSLRMSGPLFFGGASQVSNFLKKSSKSFFEHPLPALQYPQALQGTGLRS